jgi:phage terminase large subunit GpA-like protein
MPSKDDVKNRVEARIRPMFAANEDLLRHVGGRVKNIFIGKQTVMDHMIQYIGWPTTPQALADKPCCYIIADETGKYPPFVGLEADPISLMRKRQRWFKGRSKLLGMTTPVTAGDMSDAEWSRGDRCQWWAPCPHCGKWHRIEWENVKIERKQDKSWYAESVYAKGHYARYVCPKCGALWSEEDRWRAVTAGRFVPGDCELDDSGQIIGKVTTTSFRSCRIHALMLHPMVETVTSLVIEFVRAQRAKSAGNIQPLKDFWNSQLARPWHEERAATSIDILRTHIGSYPPNKVPAGAALLTAGIDVQLDHCFMRVLGWGYLGEFWSIFDQRIETGPTDRLENLEKLIPFIAMRFELMEDSSKVMRIALAAIDRMYNTETVDSLCVRCAGVAPVIPVAGDDKLSKQAWRVGRAAGGRLQRYDLNVTAYKDALHRAYFEATAPGAGYGHLHRDTEYVVLEHLTSEKKIIERKGDRIKWIGWVIKTPGRANHYWDCDVYARAAAEIAGLWSIADPAAPKKEIVPAGKPVKKRPIRTRY